MTEHEAGEGKLISLTNQRRVYMVDYVLDVETRIGGESKTVSPPRVVRSYSLQVRPLGNDELPDGSYSLGTDDEILDVRHLGQEWEVVRT